MSADLFSSRDGMRVSRRGGDEYELAVTVPVGPDGMFGRACPNDKCAPGYLKIKPGTGITAGQTEAYCPYCRTAGEPGSFTTAAQRDHALAVVKAEAVA